MSLWPPPPPPGPAKPLTASAVDVSKPPTLLQPNVENPKTDSTAVPPSVVRSLVASGEKDKWEQVGKVVSSSAVKTEDVDDDDDENDCEKPDYHDFLCDSAATTRLIVIKLEFFLNVGDHTKYFYFSVESCDINESIEEISHFGTIGVIVSIGNFVLMIPLDTRSLYLLVDCGLMSIE